MIKPQYQQDLIDMEQIIFKFYSCLFGARGRLDSYEEKYSGELPEKIEMYPLLQKLKDTNASYNENTEKYDFTNEIEDTGLEDIILKDCKTFEEIIKKIDENEQIDKETIFYQNITLTKNEIKQLHTDIDTAQNINHTWYKHILEQKNKIKF